MNLNPEIWGPHYWFFLHTIAISYPIYPNSVTKKKYYEFISNLPLFIPVEYIANQFSKLLDKYPITPYLDSRDSFIRWMHFIHNKINANLEKPKLSLHEFYVKYYEKYNSKDVKINKIHKWKKHLIYTIIILSMVFFIFYFYHK